jgi:hypothetical protein
LPEPMFFTASSNQSHVLIAQNASQFLGGIFIYGSITQTVRAEIKRPTQRR